MLRPKGSNRLPARKPFLKEGAPTAGSLATPGARLRRTLDLPGKDFGRVPPPPSHVLDRIAEESLTRGYSKKRNPKCEDCGAMKSLVGGCFCYADDRNADTFVAAMTEKIVICEWKLCGKQKGIVGGCYCD